MTDDLSLLLLPTTLLAVALAVLGCGSSEEVPVGIREVRTTAGHPAPHPAGPFDADDPAIGNLDPELLVALQAAGRDARADGVALEVTSGWRTREHQQRLYDEAVADYGSEEEARRFVATPDTSAHVTGDAVDIGPTDGALWLGEHGSGYGLCQVFANEIWHFELATEAGGSCPEMLPDGSSRT